MQAKWGIISLGNPLVGDDGVGCWLAEQLRRSFPQSWIHELGTDLLKIQALQPYPPSLIFLDAVKTGANPGTIHHPTEVELLQSPTVPEAHGFGLSGALGLLLQTDEAFCATQREWWLIEIEQLQQPYTLSASVRDGAQRLLLQLIQQLHHAG